MRVHRSVRWCLTAVCSAALFVTFPACTGPKGDAGPPGADGAQGSDGLAGPPGANAPDGRISIQLPGPDFFPEGIAAAADGSFYVGSLGTGAIVRVPPGALGAVPFVPGRAAFGVYGLAVDDARGTLWACTYDDNLAPAQGAYLTAYALGTGELKGSYVMPGDSGFCNDVTVDSVGNVYATDSFASSVVRLPVGGTAVETWATNAAFNAEPWTITLNGIVLDGASHLYVVKYDTGELFSIPIQADGSAGEPVAIAVTPALSSLDGLERIDANTLLAVEFGTGQVVTVTLSGTTGHSQVIANGLINPTNAVLDGNSAWVLESHLALFGTDEHPSLPFRVHRIALP